MDFIRHQVNEQQDIILQIGSELYKYSSERVIVLLSTCFLELKNKGHRVVFAVDAAHTAITNPTQAYHMLAKSGNYDQIATKPCCIFHCS